MADVTSPLCGVFHAAHGIVVVDPFEISWTVGNGTSRRGSLFALFAALARQEVDVLPNLRPHQREPFHAFAVQVAAIALIRAEYPPLPQNEAGWHTLLLGLTPDWPGGEAWALVGNDWTRPALLQPPIVSAANQAEYRTTLATPDALDMLITSRNHDVKASQMEGAAAEDWFFALLALQTTEGFLGAGNYGISRMNGGFASRMAMGLRVQGSLAAAWLRDVERLLDEARATSTPQKGIALLWLPPWDGTVQLAFPDLHPLYIDICRRVRLRRLPGGGIAALTAGSKGARVAAAALKGMTGDPWMPIKADGSSSVTPNASGFGYREITRLLDPKWAVRPLLARSSPSDPDHGMALVAAALVRGQGKTEGLHRRTIPFSRVVSGKLMPDHFLDRMGEVAAARRDDAGSAARLLSQALLVLIQGGPGSPRRDDKSSEDKVAPWLARFNRSINLDFFGDPFWDEVAGKATAPRRTWRARLRELARIVFDEASAAAPRTAERRIRAQARARNVLDGTFRSFVENVTDDA